MIDFTKSNRWKALKKKSNNKGEENLKELLNYIELLERQLETIELILHKHIMETENANKKSEDDGK